MKTDILKQRSVMVILVILMGTITLGVVFLVLAPFLAWQLAPFRELNIWTVDKTVPYPDYREHAGFFWVLKNEKIAKLGSRQLYDEKSDYFGFYPYGKNEWRGVSLPSEGTRPDIVYITDTYGVYKDDYMQKKLSGDISPKLYGALNTQDIQTIRKNLGSGNTFIAEFNTAASPTNLKDRLTLGSLLGVHWKGWIGKYFEDLTEGKEVPAWVIANYSAQTKRRWEFFGRGVILISDEDRVEVLTEKDDMGPAGLRFSYREPWAGKLESKKPVSYRYWFEWTIPDKGLETVADYNFDLTASGMSKLDALGLPARFPAILLYENPQYTGWYFAGDFADLNFVATPYRMKGIAWLKKLLIDDTVDSNAYFFWKAYVPLVRSILSDAEEAKAKRARMPDEQGEPRVNARAFGNGFQKRDRYGIWKDFFVRGVNMGMAEPGKYFTNFPQTLSTYARWLDGISAMNANTIRIYTLPPPEFYKALYAHNTETPEKALYLLQEIWPEENPPNGDYLAPEYREGFLKEIDYGIDAVYGRANVPERGGRAWGIYTADVSRWLLGWLVGRELESEEVMETDARNKNARYAGKYVAAGPMATPTEVWLAESLDEVASIEAARYGQLHPVALVSWPTLDPKEHDSEWDPVTGKKKKGNDRASVTIDHFEITPAMTAGLFGAYHIYPNYPDFMNNEVAYASYEDEEGSLRYGGYLREFMESHRRYPALVAEFGLANGSGIAHLAPDGLHHGGIDEASAGKGILRMMNAIKKEGYAGGVIFEWMDEWVKKTWTTETLMIPYDRHVLWHNAVDPEQNYGLMANEVLPPGKPDLVYKGKGIIDSMEVSADASYLNIAMTLKRPPDFAVEEILVGLDTLRRDLGQTLWPVGGLKTSSGLEFVLRISAANKADLLVIPSYNAAMSRFATVAASDGKYERIDMLVNGAVKTKDGRSIAEKRFDASALRRGPFDEAGNLWNIEGAKISLRLPWTYINVTDPSSRQVLQDPRTGYFNPQRDALDTVATDGFLVDAIAWDKKLKRTSGGIELNTANPYYWKGWEEPPPYREKPKKSYYIVRNAWAAEAAAERTLK
ncbi:MAG TPA: hypothetical protein VN445_02945 [Rectinemataceae bacterium]|nr:hypothetical protein [Rectinemataceae bacterium]